MSKFVVLVYYTRSFWRGHFIVAWNSEVSLSLKPSPTSGMRHIALNVKNISACEHFYVDLLGMKVEWRPDPDNLYLTSGNDNLALHKSEFDCNGRQILDHIGFILNHIDDVDAWCEFLKQHQIQIVKQPRTHRDGARSFYCLDPEGVTVQMIYHPPLSATWVFSCTINNVVKRK